MQCFKFQRTFIITILLHVRIPLGYWKCLLSFFVADEVLVLFR